MPPEPIPTDKSEAAEKSDAEPAFSEQLADILIKVVMTGGVAGGGLGAF